MRPFLFILAIVASLLLVPSAPAQDCPGGNCPATPGVPRVLRARAGVSVRVNTSARRTGPVRAFLFRRWR